MTKTDTTTLQITPQMLLGAIVLGRSFDPQNPSPLMMGYIYDISRLNPQAATLEMLESISSEMEKFV